MRSAPAFVLRLTPTPGGSRRRFALARQVGAAGADFLMAERWRQKNERRESGNNQHSTFNAQHSRGGAQERPMGGESIKSGTRLKK